MKYFKRISMTFLFCYATFILHAQNLDADFANKLSRIYKYGKLVEEIADDFFKKYEDCLAVSNNSGYCAKTAGICTMWDFTTNNLPGLPAEIYRILGLFEAFKPYCGNGTCFQCCFNGSGCHTSFIGFPVINCNYNYGPQTRAAGNTVVVDPNPQPGQLCLFTPQTCEHVGICFSNLSQSQITAINNNPLHIIKSDRAKKERARTIAQSSLELGFRDFIRDYSQGMPIKDFSGKVLKKEINDDDLVDLLSGRGSRYWYALLDSLNRNQGNIIGLRIVDTITNTFIPSATKWNITRHLFLAHYLSSAPNLLNRMAFTESKIWTQSDKSAYIVDTAKVDSIFLKAMHPIALSILSRNYSLQDYRLLSVPLPGEIVSERLYNGDTLGVPPIINLDENNGLLRIKVAEKGTHLTTKPLSVLIVWGDGTTTDTLVDITNVLQIRHSYNVTGEYRVSVFVQNTAGLRSIYLKKVRITTSEVNTFRPSFNRFTFEKLSLGTSDLWTIMPAVYLDFYGGTNERNHRIGSSKAVENIFRETRVSDTLLSTYNSNLKPFNNISIVPRHSVASGYSFLSFSHLRAFSFNSNQMRDTFFALPINVNLIKLYDNNGNLINNTNMISVTPLGGVKIFFLYDTIRVNKITIQIPETLFNMGYIPPGQIFKPETDGQFKEIRPDLFVKHVETPSGGGSLDNAQLIRVYPNPTNGLIFVNRSLQSVGDADLFVFRANGQQVRRIRIKANQSYFEFDIGRQAAGVYFWRYIEADKVQHGKVIKFN